MFIINFWQYWKCTAWLVEVQNEQKFPKHMIHVEEKIKKHCQKISEESLWLTVKDIKNGEDLEKAKELGADDDFLKKKSIVLTKILEKLV